MVGVTGFEPAASTSQTSRATNCATPRFCAFHYSRVLGDCQGGFRRDRSVWMLNFIWRARYGAYCAFFVFGSSGGALQKQTQSCQSQQAVLWYNVGVLKERGGWHDLGDFCGAGHGDGGVFARLQRDLKAESLIGCVGRGGQAIALVHGKAIGAQPGIFRASSGSRAQVGSVGEQGPKTRKIKGGIL